MNFNSPLFLLFITVVVTFNYFLSQRYRPSLLLFSGFLFIAYFNLESLFVVLTLAVFNFFVGLKISGNRFLYLISLFLNIAAMLLYNYFHVHQSNILFKNEDVGNSIILLGLLFYSLQNIAYITEVYYKRMQPEKSVLKYTLYISFFPKIISGPVMLPGEFISQIGNNKPSKEMLVGGFNRFLFGLVKKMVIADRLAPAVHSIFDFSDNYSGITTWGGV